jgi:hypothetical protein
MITLHEQENEPVESAGITPEAVRAELRRIIPSRHFRSSKRSQQFLQYVVEQKLQGNESIIKERLIGIEVFGRKPNYATGDDPVVRVQAGDVRRRLGAYQAEFWDDLEVVIDLPTGSYVPIFRRRTSESVTEDSASSNTFTSSLVQASALEGYAAPLSSTSPSPAMPPNHLSEVLDRIINVELPIVQKTRTRSRLLFLVVLSMLIALTFGDYWLNKFNPATNAFTTFWGPIMNSPKPTVISLGKPFVYVPGAGLFNEYRKEHPNSFTSPADRHNKYLPLDGNTPLSWSDLRPVLNSGPAIGGVRSAMLLSAILGRLGKPFVVRFGDESSYLELRDSPAIIVGGLNNRWTSEIDQDLHFGIHDNNTYQYIVEAGTNHVWKEESTSHGVTDYGIITRELVGPTGQFLVKIAGMSDNGTEAASELVTNTDELSKVIQTLPKHWESKNLQLLVRTDIIGGKAGPPKLIATYVW